MSFMDFSKTQLFCHFFFSSDSYLNARIYSQRFSQNKTHFKMHSRQTLNTVILLKYITTKVLN